MELTNEFTVPAPTDVAWAVLSDLEKIAPCMPGAVLDERHGDEYLGRVKVRMGPVGLSFSGRATVLVRDEVNRRLVVRGTAQDRGGQGGAEALITMTVAEAAGTGVTEVGSSSTVRVVTELGLSGKVAQFGSGALTHVNRRIIGQFVQRLDVLVRQGPSGASVTSAGADGPVWSPPPRQPQPQWFGRLGRSRTATSAAAVAAGVLLGVAISRALRSIRAAEVPAVR